MWSYNYDAFGASTNVKHDPTNKKQFTGKENDEDSGLQYFIARYYDPTIGRFLSKDPVPNGNLYVYCDNNPINKTDPDGRQRTEKSDRAFVERMLPYAKEVEKQTGVKADLVLTIWYHESGAGDGNDNGKTYKENHNYANLGPESGFTKFKDDSEFVNSKVKGKEGWVSLMQNDRTIISCLSTLKWFR